MKSAIKTFMKVDLSFNNVKCFANYNDSIDKFLNNFINKLIIYFISDSCQKQTKYETYAPRILPSIKMIHVFYKF